MSRGYQPTGDGYAPGIVPDMTSSVRPASEARKIAHPAYGYLQNIERCWTDSDEQASRRAHLIVKALADAGMLVDAVVHGTLVLRAAQ